MVFLSNLVPNEKLTMSMIKDVLFNKEAQKREMDIIDKSESQVVVSQEVGKEVEVKENVIKGVLGEDDRGHSQEVAFLCAYIETRRGI